MEGCSTDSGARASRALGKANQCLGRPLPFTVSNTLLVTTQGTPKGWSHDGDKQDQHFQETIDGFSLSRRNFRKENPS